jgi:hypothetical protein
METVEPLLGPPLHMVGVRLVVKSTAPHMYKKWIYLPNFFLLRDFVKKGVEPRWWKMVTIPTGVGMW